ncbi:hypothetical protein [Algoriphagus persicinus]|uniref:hypothetical protein n=1 Tax=Algoriphagus persicinus TaxID=3108754 RepID=UPI002B388103|nr:MULTISPECIES: hypothetical protein [unclassified Algoriphagus]MEB2780061.1 hypothetical protein [Algoriphagus sp. C2-6-M1]MEB2785615.1 hypothetical protein [Algoriphagus sp. E1-3-M2]
MEVLRTAILDRLNREKGEFFTTCEIVQLMFPQDWDLFLEEVNTVAIELYHEGLINLSSSELPIDYDTIRSIPLIISSPIKL